MADSALLDPPQFPPFPQTDPPDSSALGDPFDFMEIPFDFPSDLADIAFDFDFVDDLLDFSDPQYDSPPESTTAGLPSSESSNSREVCGSASEASGNADPTPSASPENHIYASQSPESHNSATEGWGEGKRRNLKRKKGVDDVDRSVIPDGGNGNRRSSKFRRPGLLDEADSSCLVTAGSEDGEKRRLRLMRNRESAQLSRQRRKQYVEELQEKVKSMHSTISELNGRIAFIMAENASLRQQLAGSATKGVTPAVYPGMPPMVPMHFPWVPYSGYAARLPGSQVPLVPIPKLKHQPSAPAVKAKKSEGKKAESRTKKVASVSLLGLLFFSLIVGAIVSGGDFRYGELLTGEGKYGKSGIASHIRGRILTVSGNIDLLDQSSKTVHLNGIHLRDKRLGRETSGKVAGGAHEIPGSCEPTFSGNSSEPTCSGNSSEPLFASLYVPRNDRLVKIDGNLIISSVVAGENAKAQTSFGVKDYVAEGGQETNLAIASSVSSALAVVNSGRDSHMYRVTGENQKALPSGSTDMYADKWDSASSDRLPQDWFHEGLEGPIFSSGVCTEVFRFASSKQHAGIVPATSVANATKNITEEPPCSEGKLRNRRILYTHPIPLSGSTSNTTEKITGVHHPDGDSKANLAKGSNSIVVSVLVDPREVGDRDSDGMIMPKSISKIFVVVLVDSVKYITYSCILPFKSNAPHLVAR